MLRTISIAAMLCLCVKLPAQTKNFIDQPYVEVNGTADTLVTPNEIYLRILLAEKDTRDKNSVEELEKKMIEALQGTGADLVNDLRMADMNSNFKSHLFKRPEILKNKSYSLKVGDAKTASLVFARLEEAGISNTAIERVSHCDLDLLKNQMRTRAISDARNRALALTKSLDQSVGKAIHIADLENHNQHLQGNVSGIYIVGVARKQEDEMPEIEFEKIRVSASVNAKFVVE